MKKVYFMFFAVGMISIVACGGPSAEDKAKMEADAAKVSADSMMNAANQNMAADSTAKATADSTAK